MTKFYQNGMFSVENELFYEDNKRLGYFEDKDLFELKAKKFVLEIFRFKGQPEIITPKIEIKKDYNMPEWITCEHRMRRYEEGLGVQSYCLHPLNPLSTKFGMWLVICNKNECKLKKYYDLF